MLPGIEDQHFMNSKLLQPQLDLANANQDRQIYPEIHPGPDSNTTSLMLRVKDQLPLHAKIEANNASTPGTPDMRLATSAVTTICGKWIIAGRPVHFFRARVQTGRELEPLRSSAGGQLQRLLPPAAVRSASVAEEAAQSRQVRLQRSDAEICVAKPATGAPELNVLRQRFDH
jgi:hypothetical protein